MRIGLALSGGGIRATVFHLGVLARLAKQSAVENITLLSTVSGGSLTVALVHGCSEGAWPGSVIFLQHTIPKARCLLTGRSLNHAYFRHMLLSPWVLRHVRAAALAEALQDCWSVVGALSDLPESPRWNINATCFETGKNWRFMKKRMGDYVTGYVSSPKLPIARAVAASSAVPGLIGSLRLNTDQFEWFTHDRARTPKPHDPRFQSITLWDGGVYGSLGVEALFKPGGGSRDAFDFLIVSDASALLDSETRTSRAPLRLLNVATDQVRGLRARAVVSYLQCNPSTGAYLKMGNTEERIYREAGTPDIAKRISRNSLSDSDVRQAANIGTTLRKLAQCECDLLFAHGYQVADATLSAFCSGPFEPTTLAIPETTKGTYLREPVR